MKKTIFTIFMTAIAVVGLKAQTVQEGKSHLYAKRYTNAKSVFEKLLAVNPNNIEATYWLGQTILEMEEIAGARRAAAAQLYSKALQSSANAPLLLVGMGHVELLENKTNEARQRFETALTMTRTKRGDDPTILTAIGRANVDAKTGDFNYAISKLQAASDKGEKNPEILLELGNAYRKAKPGEGGGDAYKSYKKALENDPKFAVASLRLAQLFESQKNSELILQYLNESVSRDPGFTAGYYELFYYYFFRGKFPEAEEQLKKYIDSKLPEKDIQDEYLYAQLCWARKDYACAVQRAEAVVTSMGSNTKPKVYRLLADAYYQKGDYANAKKFSDEFFAKKNPEDVILPDFEIKALILGQLGGNPDEVYNTYIGGVALDTTVEAKVEFLKKGAVYFKDKKVRDKEALMMEKLISIKPKPTINDYFDLTLAYYFSNNYAKSREAALVMRDEKFADQVYGYEWAFNNANAVDTLKQDSIAAPDALKLYEFAGKDTAKFRKQYINSVRFLAAYYINKAKDKEKSLEFFRKWQAIDVANATTIQSYIDQIEKMPVKPNNQKTGGTKPASKPAAVIKKSAPKTVIKS